jgi:uncharacterized protein YgiM (DUF1202 family)
MALLTAIGLATMSLLSTALAATGPMGTAYVSDDLVLGVYAEKDPQSTRLATLHSGAALEVLATDGEFTQVRLGDGRVGWVRSSFLITREPAAARVKELEDEISRARAATPELAAAARNNEIEQLKAGLAAAQAELQRARVTSSGARGGLNPAPEGSLAFGKAAIGVWPLALGVILGSAALGFVLGYCVLARRVRAKFGGIKVY